MKCQLPNCNEIATAECNRCHIFEYCCREHQLLHWRQHKKICGKMSTVVLPDNVTCTLIEQEEFRYRVNLDSREELNDLSVKIRKEFLRKEHNRYVPTYSPELALVHQQLPRYEFLVDLKCRPTRIFSVKELLLEKADFHATTISVNRAGRLFFVIGGIHPSNLRIVKQWDRQMIEMIKASEHPGIFFDPLGLSLAVQLAHSTGYFKTSQTACSCQRGAKFFIDQPFLEHKAFQKAKRVCDTCGQPGAHLHLCGWCRKVAYCSIKCQNMDWPVHKKKCRGP